MANRLDRKNRVYFRVVIVLTLIIIGLMVATFWHIQHPEEPKYFQVKIEQGKKQFIQLQAYNARLLSRDDLLLWVQVVVGDIYTFNAITYPQKFKDLLAKDFTPAGADSFRQVLEDSQLLQQVTTQQLNLTSIVSGQPVILKEGALLGKYSWKVQMPVLLTFESANQITTKRIIVTVLIVNVPTKESPQAVAIQEIWSTE
ncbi:MAG: icmL [Gammaproteobacteria bacterium]|jgi:intracellular multiplication protein IcmL|nr:icmL [Gammaproteobacteria bacterium]